MDTLYTKLHISINRIQGSKEQEFSLLTGILIAILILPIATFILYLPIGMFIDSHAYTTREDIHASVLLGIFCIIIGGSILRYIYKGLETNLCIIFLLKALKRFNLFWKENTKKLQDLDEILYGIESIHKKISKLAVLNNTDYSIDSKYLTLQKLETEYFIEILLDLRSDLATRLTEQQQILEGAKTEVEKNITGTPELIAVSEAQKLRLDRQIEQFEELQRVLVRV